MPPNAAMVLREIKNAIELNAIPKDAIKEKIKNLESLMIDLISVTMEGE